MVPAGQWETLYKNMQPTLFGEMRSDEDEGRGVANIVVKVQRPTSLQTAMATNNGSVQ